MSGIGAPLMGGFEWQPWQRACKTACTSHGSPLGAVVVPVDPPVPVAPPAPARPPVPVVVVPVAPPLPVVVPQVPRGYAVVTQVVSDAISVAVARALGAGGMGAAAFWTRDSARWA